MPLALVRHGQTDWNLHGRVQGRSDIPLNDTGREQARAAAEVLGLGEWDAIVSSPLSRARETANIIAGSLGIELGPSYDDLVERDYGSGEGMYGHELRANWPNFDFPGIEPEEDVAERGQRMVDALDRDFAGARVAAVAHGTFIRLTLSSLLGQPVERILNGAVATIERDQRGWQLHTLNNEPLVALVERD